MTAPQIPSIRLAVIFLALMVLWSMPAGFVKWKCAHLDNEWAEARGYLK